jgi:hypothetical protein
MGHAAALNEKVNRHRISQAIGNQEVWFFAVCLQASQRAGSTIEHPHSMTSSFQKQRVYFHETLLIVYQVDERPPRPSGGAMMGGTS